MLTSAVQLILVLVILGVVWYLIDRFIPMQPIMRTIITVVIVIFVVIWLLQLIGINVTSGLNFR